MRQLARPFGYTWLRSGKTGGYRYELAQDLKSQLLEEELRNRDRNQAIVALDREMSQFQPYLGLTPEQARAGIDGRLHPRQRQDRPSGDRVAGDRRRRAHVGTQF